MEEKGVEFYETPKRGTLDGYAVGEPGQRRLEFSFIAGSDVLNYDHLCFGADTSQTSSRDPLFVSISVNGHPQTGVSCSTSPPLQPAEPTVGSGDATEREARNWESYEVVAGSRMQVVAELESAEGEPRSDPDITIGAGFWSLDGAPGRQVTANVLVSQEPVLVRWGFAGSGGSFTLYPGGAGDPTGVSAAEGRGGSEHFLPSGNTAGMRLVAERVEENAVTLVIAVYGPID